MQIRVEVPLSLRLIPPAFVRQAVGGMTQEQIKTNFPNVANRMLELGKYAATSWKERIVRIPGATGRPLQYESGKPMVQLNRTAYEASVLVAPPEWEPSAIGVTVYSDSPQAEPIETGGEEIDLHNVLATAPKARLSKRGDLYLRIPFRHATQSAEGGPVLPKSVIKAMQPKAKYVMVGSYLERGPNMPHGMVTRFLYSKRPGRLMAADIAALNMAAAAKKGYLITPAHAAKLAGLMRVGAKGHGGYLTIRTLSEANAEGWRIPAYPAQHVLQAVAQEMQTVLQGFFDEALQADMQIWLANAGAAA